MTEIESLRRLTEAVETASTDIAPTYNEYVQLAFAIATDCGEAGREHFHRLCRISAKYQREHADRIFSSALTTKHGDVHLGTAFHLAEVAGVVLKQEEITNKSHLTGTNGAKNAKSAENAPDKSLTHTRVYNNVREDQSASNEDIFEGSEPLHPLPTFPQADWPELLTHIMSYGTTKAQHDVLLLGALTTLGASMERYVRCPYGGQYQYPCMQSFIVAPSASGKRVLSYLRLLVEPIHDELRQKFEEKMKIYKKEKSAYDAMGKERANQEAPEKPVNKMFLISGNNTGTGILQNLMDSDGIGLIIETEADTISTAIGTDHGHWSDTLRKAFDHDRLSYNRRTNEEYREIKKTFLSVLISGTPGQVVTLIPIIEDGQFARNNFIYMPGIIEWKSQFFTCEEDLEEIFAVIGLEWKKKLDELKKHGIHTLRLTDEQKHEFDDFFSTLFFRSRIANESAMFSSVARLGVNACRMMTEVAVLRILEKKDPYDYKTNPHLSPDPEISADNINDNIITRWDVTISTEDFRAVLNLIEPLYCHATHILSFLPSTKISHKSNADQDLIFEKLGPKFTRTQLMEQASALGINSNTATSWLTRLLKRGLLVKTDERGTYTRARVCVREGTPE